MMIINKKMLLINSKLRVIVFNKTKTNYRIKLNSFLIMINLKVQDNNIQAILYKINFVFINKDPLV